MHIQYMTAAIGEDLVAEGWVVRRGRRVVFCEAEVRGGTTGKLIAKSMLTYNVQMVDR
jgi:acyl-coenzyme A thioesterase PaaI-like protein